MEFLKGVGVFILILIGSFIIGGLFSGVYKVMLGSSGGFFGFDLGSSILGLLIAYTFLEPLLFTSILDNLKYWWMGILLIPVVWFVIQFDLYHWWFYVLIALIGWVAGWGINKLIMSRETSPSS